MPIACGRSAHAAPLLSRAIRRPIMCNHECHRCPCLTVGSSSRPSIGPDRLHLITCLFIGAHCFLLGLGCDLGCVPCTVCGVVPVLHQADKQTSLVCSVDCVTVDSHAINLVSPWSRWSRARLSMQAFPVAEGCDKLLFGANHGQPRFLGLGEQARCGHVKLALLNQLASPLGLAAQAARNCLLVQVSSTANTFAFGQSGGLHGVHCFAIVSALLYVAIGYTSSRFAS